MDDIIYSTKYTSSFNALSSIPELMDMSLICEDQQVLRAHKVVLCSMSNVFKSIIIGNLDNSLIYLKGIKMREMESLLELLYQGEVRVQKQTWKQS